MIIRPSTEHDLPAIVNLLKISLGESLMPKSESFWRWKHQLNPFGPSPVLLAFEDDELIGVRAFMQWQWQCGNRIHRAVRAVDTATNPAHQGKGIFKKLTLELLSRCEEQGIDFVFNTPNDKSRPGYLKMGWQTAGKLAIAIRPGFSIHKPTPVTQNWEELWSFYGLEALIDQAQPKDVLTTKLSTDYLRWRYFQNPNVRYEFIADLRNEGFILIYRLVKRKGFLEVRVVDCFSINPSHVRLAIRTLCRLIPQAKVITVSGLDDRFGFRTGFLKIPMAGPIVTVRNINTSVFDETINFTRWRPSLGDMEVF